MIIHTEKDDFDIMLNTLDGQAKLEQIVEQHNFLVKENARLRDLLKRANKYVQEPVFTGIDDIDDRRIKEWGDFVIDYDKALGGEDEPQRCENTKDMF